MASLRYKQIFPLVALSLLSCHAHKSVTYVEAPPEYVKPPVIDIPLPNVDFQFLLPEPPELATIHAPRKDITETLTARDKSHVKAEDPKRFADGDTEIHARDLENYKARRAECKQKKQTEFSLLFEIYTKQKGGSGSYGNGF